MKLKILRRAFQVFILGAVLYLALGFGLRNFENFCPFGGAESLYSFFKSKTLSCAISPWNLAVFFSILALTLIAKKSFCGWACPIGFIYEILAKVQSFIFKKREFVPQRVDKYLRYLRYVVLVAVLYLTWTETELVFRAYDPYYLIFSGMGHGTAGAISIAVIAFLVVSGVVVKMSWCRYFCPMTAVMDTFSYPSLVAVKRSTDLCKDCKKCDAACQHDLQPSKQTAVNHVDCSNCLNCIEACPEKNCMSLVLQNRFKKNAPSLTQEAKA